MPTMPASAPQSLTCAPSPPESAGRREPIGSDSEWTTVIEPHRGWFDWRLHELWRYRDLILLFVWRDFVVTYKQTILGPAWHIIQPLLTTLTYTLIFGRVAKLSTDGTPSFLFYMAGNVIWGYFATCLTKTASTFTANANLFGKVYFHRLVMPVAVVLSNLIAFAIQFAVFLAFLLLYHVRGVELRPTTWVFFLPVQLIVLAALGLGFGIIVSALTTRYRDLAHLVTFGVQLWMFATPVVYPASSIPEKYRWVFLANPVSPVIESFRLGFLGSGTFSSTQLATCAATTALVLVVGLVLFSRVEKTFMDTV